MNLDLKTKIEIEGLKNEVKLAMFGALKPTFTPYPSSLIAMGQTSCVSEAYMFPSPINLDKQMSVIDMLLNMRFCISITSKYLLCCYRSDFLCCEALHVPISNSKDIQK
jgi:hypothetical protein